MGKHNKLFLLLLTLLAALALTACGTAPGDAPLEPTQTGDMAQPEDNQPDQTQPAEQEPVEPIQPEDEAAVAELTALLQTLRERIQPGTSGSSLVAISLAAQLLDYQAQKNMSEADVVLAAAAFLADLDESAAALFQEQLADVYGASQSLYSESAADILEVSGCPAEQFAAYPWSEQTGQVLFAALYAGCGWELQ